MNLKHKTKVTFYNGLTTIGGPMIEVAYNDSHVLFDLGEVFKPDLELADESFQTLIDNQLIGDVPDFYDYHLTGKKLSDSHWKDSAAYISHVHLDHSKALNLLDESVKLYTGPITASMLPVLNKDGNYLLPAAGKPKNYTRPIIAAELNVPIKVGDITLEIVPSDHDAYGATGLIIKTPDKKIAYTGDIRLHGYHPEWVEAFMHKGHGCDMLIIESTALSWPNENHSEEFTGPKNEDELIDRIVKYQIDNPKRQITFNTYISNVERILRIIKDSPRKVVLSAKRAEFLKLSIGVDVAYYYLPGEEIIPILHSDLEVDYNTLLADESEFLWQAVADFDKLKSGSLYIHSNAEPLGSFDPAYQPFVDTLEQHQVEVVMLRCSGHASASALEKIIRGFEPNVLVPVHSMHPELLENPCGSRLLPERNQVFTFE